MADADWARRHELNDLLRACRSRLARPLPEGRTMRKWPGGSPPGSARGLRQADAAVLAGLSLRAYADFERGAGRQRPQPGLVDRVATALRMTDAERSALHILATQQDPPRLITGAADAPPREPGQALRDLADRQSPYPSALTDETWTVVHCNDAMDAWSGGWYSRRAAEERNMALYLWSPHAEALLPDIQQIRRGTIAALRYQYTRNLASARTADLVRRLCACPEAARLWAQHEMAIPKHEYPFRIRHRDGVADAHVAFPAIHPWLWHYTLILPEGISPPERTPQNES